MVPSALVVPSAEVVALAVVVASAVAASSTYRTIKMVRVGGRGKISQKMVSYSKFIKGSW